MPAEMIYEIIGYAASVLIAISLMMRSILKLRVINLIGSVVFTIYGLVIRAYPVAAVNFFIVLINLYFLYQIFSTREYFRLFEVPPDSEYLREFLQFYGKDIQRFQPGQADLPGADALIFFILRDMVPAGLVIGEMRKPGSLDIRLDYAIPGYRDLKTARFVFRDNAQALKARGIDRVYSEPGTADHNRYLERMGFELETIEGGKRYCLTL